MLAISILGLWKDEGVKESIFVSQESTAKSLYLPGLDVLLFLDHAVFI